MRFWPIGVVVALILATGIVRGMWTERWQPSEARQQAGTRIARVPLVLADWVGEEEQLDERDRVNANLEVYFWRKYVHRKTGQSVSVLLAGGRVGDLAVHTPDVCYPSSGYEMAAKPRSKDFAAGEGQPKAEFWTARFYKKQALGQEKQAIWWAWSANGDWSAARYPRFHFAGQSVLYKLYIICPLPSASEPPENDAGADFIRVLVPALKECLF